MHNKKLDSIIYKTFLKSSLFPILIIELLLLALYFGINNYSSSQNIKLILEDTKKHLKKISENDANFIDKELQNVVVFSTILQKEHEQFFKNPDNSYLPNGKPFFQTAPNGAFYKVNKNGSSLYYSSKTKIQDNELKKALKTEFMDASFKNIVEANENIVAAYFNSWDNMNRLYPFIDNVYEQYGDHIIMEDYNFYYLADIKHNPHKKPVWTDVYLDPAGNGLMLSCVVPIYNKDFLEGVTGLDITINKFLQNILIVNSENQSKAFLIKDDGKVLVMSDEIKSLLNIDKTIKIKDLNLYQLVNSELKTKLKSKEDFIEFKYLDNDYFLLKTKIKLTNWNLMVLVPKKEIFKPINELKTMSDRIGYFAVLFMILFYLFFFFYLDTKSKEFSKTISKPIIDLIKYLENIGKNKNLDTRINTDIAEIDFIVKINKRMQLLNEEFYKKNLELDDLNKNLENRIKEEVNKNRESETILIQNSKMAEVGQMMASLIHQWKQPISTISIAISTLKIKADLNIQKSEDINKANDLIIKQITLVNQTMDDFRNFFKSSEKKSFYISSLVNTTISFIEDIYKKQNININVEILEDSQSFGFKNELIQVLLNIFNNARDIILEKELKNREIEVIISIDKNKNMALIQVKDFAGGIPKEILPKIFDSYFTTKSDDKGTGIGLYMSKTIVKKSNGILEVENHTKEILNENLTGANFKLYLPI